MTEKDNLISTSGLYICHTHESNTHECACTGTHTHALGVQGKSSFKEVLLTITYKMRKKKAA